MLRIIQMRKIMNPILRDKMEQKAPGASEEHPARSKTTGTGTQRTSQDSGNFANNSVSATFVNPSLFPRRGGHQNLWLKIMKSTRWRKISRCRVMAPCLWRAAKKGNLQTWIPHLSQSWGSWTPRQRVKVDNSWTTEKQAECPGLWKNSKQGG